MENYDYEVEESSDKKETLSEIVELSALIFSSSILNFPSAFTMIYSGVNYTYEFLSRFGYYLQQGTDFH